MKKSANETKHKPFYIPNRDCYLSVDGSFYCYKVWDDKIKRTVTQKIAVDKDLSVDITLVLDELDHDEDLQEHYERKRRDSVFDCEMENYQLDLSNNDPINPWEKIGDKGNSPEDIILAEPEKENPLVAKVRTIIDKKCTEKQKKFIADHFGMRMKLQKMRQAEAAETGKLPSLAAMSRRKGKILDKVAEGMGVKRIKRRKNPKK